MNKYILTLLLISVLIGVWNGCKVSEIKKEVKIMQDVNNTNKEFLNKQRQLLNDYQYYFEVQIMGLEQKKMSEIEVKK